MDKATFAAGCFWGVEATFRKVRGVVSTRVGYMGGKADNPTYEQVCSGRTGHAEAIEIEFDPREVTYERLLEIFWNMHDPTTLNRQGPDRGTQYRSAIFYHNPEQKRLAEESLQTLENSGRHGDRRIVTEIVPADTFWPAEEYHQCYFEKTGRDSCRVR